MQNTIEATSVMTRSLALLQACYIRTNILQAKEANAKGDCVIANGSHFDILHSALLTAIHDVRLARRCHIISESFDLAPIARRQFELCITMLWAARAGWDRYRCYILKELREEEGKRKNAGDLSYATKLNQWAIDLQDGWKRASLPVNAKGFGGMDQALESVIESDKQDPAIQRYADGVSETVARKIYLSIYGGLSKDTHAGPLFLLTNHSKLSFESYAMNYALCACWLVRAVHITHGWSQVPAFWAYHTVVTNTKCPEDDGTQSSYFEDLFYATQADLGHWGWVLPRS